MPHYDGDPEVADFIDETQYEEAAKVPVEDLKFGDQFPSHDGKEHKIEYVEKLANGDIRVQVTDPDYNVVFTGGTKTQVL